jgi:hypothetical protein
MKRAMAAVLYALAIPFALFAQLPAFPGAQGGGASASCFRGGTVIEVTSLADSGPGSLRSCLTASGPRYCIFRVNGQIKFLSRPQVSSPCVYVAGQSAPGEVVLGGVGQVGEQIFVSTNDAVFRYLTYDGYSAAQDGTGPDTGTVCCEMASGTIYNVVWDHISARWTGNKAFPAVSNVTGQGIHNMDIQWSLVYEPNVNHAVGIGTVYVSSGSGKATTDDDAHHNLFVTVDHRLPLNQSGLNVRWVNNIAYNWGQFAALSMGGVQTDYIGNKFVDGAGCLTPQGCLDYQNGHVFLGEPGNANDPPGDWPNGDNLGPPSYYLLNNTGRTGVTRGSAMVPPTHAVNDSGEISMTAQGTESGDSGSPMPKSWFRATPLPTEPFPITANDVSTLDAVLIPTVGNSQHIDCNGNWASHRNSTDARAIAIYQNNQPDDLFYGQFTAPAVTIGTPCVESMHDGIPDQWKVAHGLSTTDPNVYKAIAANGYTNLENYLNGVASGPPPPQTGWTGWLGADALTGTIAVGSTVTINSNAGPVRTSACTTAGGGIGAPLTPQPSQVVGASVLIIQGPSPVCGNGVVYWQVQSGNTPPPPVSVSVTCPASVQTGATATCTATVTGTTNQTVTWSTTAGTITSGGILTAPNTPGNVTVTATSVADPTKSGNATVNVTAVPPPNTITCTYTATPTGHVLQCPLP